MPATDFRIVAHSTVLFLLCTLFLPWIAAAQPALHGRVVDADTGAPLSEVNIELLGLNRATASDEQGRFHFVDIEAGICSVRVARIGYQPRILVAEVGTKTPLLLIKLSAAVLELSEMTVTPGAFRFMDSGEAAARQIMTRGDIETAPQFSDDIFRAVHRLPGLTAGDYAARFNIRGGRDDETLILIDGLEVYEPYHMKDFNEGAISIVDVETIDGVELLTGGFPVRYGNRMSGVFHIHSRTPRQEASRHSVGLSLMNLSARSEGRFAEGRGTYFVSARRGYLDLVLNLMNIDDLAAPVYYDAFSKVTWKLNDDHEVAVRLLHGGDSFDFDEFATTGFQDTIDTHETAKNTYGNSYSWATLTSSLSPAVTVETLLSAGLVTRERKGAEVFTDIPGGIYTVDKSRDLQLYGLQQHWQVERSASMLWQFGFDLRQQRADYQLHSLVYQDPNDPSEDALGYYPVETQAAGRESGTLLSAYAANRLRLAKPLTLELGLRYDRASHTGDSDLSPRLSAMIDLPQGSLLRLGWGQYRQMHDIHDETALDAGGRYDPSELSTQWTAGIEHLFKSGTGVRVEVYHKHSDNPRPVYRNWVAGALDVFPETNEDLLLVALRERRARGIETYISHDGGGPFALRASYAFALARERLRQVVNINAPDPLAFAAKNDAPRDQRHAIGLDLIWRPSAAWTLNLALAHHSGWPITLASAEETLRADGKVDVVARPQLLYSSRLPAYQRLDVRLTRRYRMSHGDIRVFLELINLANRENVFAYDYEVKTAADGTSFLEREGESWFPLLPSVGVNWAW